MIKKLPEYESEEYTENCQSCGEERTVYTQADRDPEYYTAVFVKCSCGNYVKFRLPVN